METLSKSANFIGVLFSGLNELLVSSGIYGFGLAIFALCSLILMFVVVSGRKLDVGMRSLITRFLYTGVFCFVFATALPHLEKLMWQPEEVKQATGSYKVKLLLSPNFDVVNLPLPEISGIQVDTINGVKTISISKDDTIQIGFDATINQIKSQQLESAQKDQKIAALNTVVNQQKIEFAAATTVVQDLAAKTEAGVQFDTQVYKSRLSNIQRNFDRLKITP